MPNMAKVTITVHNSLCEKIKTVLDEQSFAHDLWLVSITEDFENENHSTLVFERPFSIPSELIDTIVSMSDEHAMAITTEVEEYVEPTTRHYRHGKELVLVSA